MNRGKKFERSVKSQEPYYSRRTLIITLSLVGVSLGFLILLMCMGGQTPDEIDLRSRNKRVPREIYNPQGENSEIMMTEEGPVRRYQSDSVDVMFRVRDKAAGSEFEMQDGGYSSEEE